MAVAMMSGIASFYQDNKTENFQQIITERE
jgi:hypothetical protein